MTVTDKDITLALKADPEKGFRLLMGRYKEPLYWHIRRLVVSHDDAEDATQETFVRIFRNLGQYRGDTSFAAWVYRIATREALRILERNRRADVSIDSPEAAVELPEADCYVDYSDLEAVKLQRAILSLPTKQQLAFNMRYYDELSYEEIAEISDSTASAAKANYHTAKEKIIRYMTSND